MFKILVSSEQDKREILEGSEHIHDLTDLDTDIPGANLLAHLFLKPDVIEVVKGYSDDPTDRYDRHVDR